MNIKERINKFITSDNDERVIIIPEEFDGYATAVVFLACHELRQNLARAGAVGIDLPGKKINIRVADDFNSVIDDINPGAQLIIAGYDNVKYAAITPKCDPSQVSVLFSMMPDPAAKNAVVENDNVLSDGVRQAYFMKAPIFESVATMLRLTESPSIFRDEITIEERMLNEYFTPFTKRMRNWLDNCREATSLEAYFNHVFDGGWYECPMPAKEYFGYTAFASGSWPDIDVIRGRAKSLADITTGSDVFLRIDARAEMERKHIAELVKSAHRDFASSRRCTRLLLTIDVPVTLAEMAGISAIEKNANAVDFVIIQNGCDKYVFNPNRRPVDGASMLKYPSASFEVAKAGKSECEE